MIEFSISHEYLKSISCREKCVGNMQKFRVQPKENLLIVNISLVYLKMNLNLGVYVHLSNKFERVLSYIGLPSQTGE